MLNIQTKPQHTKPLSANKPALPYERAFYGSLIFSGLALALASVSTTLLVVKLREPQPAPQAALEPVVVAEAAPVAVPAAVAAPVSLPAADSELTKQAREQYAAAKYYAEWMAQIKEAEADPQ
jgi:hypothetical protein